jgi:hypothetical protein
MSEYVPSGVLPDHPDDGVEVVDDLFDQPSVETAAGRVGLLLQGESAQAHVIKQPPWLITSCDHRTESIIATLDGEWVLRTDDRSRRHMTEGSIFWFGSGVPAGFEVPFDEPATILIFKSEKPEESPEAFAEYLLERAEENEPESLLDLPADHPAVAFGREVNENFPD